LKSCASGRPFLSIFQAGVGSVVRFSTLGFFALRGTSERDKKSADAGHMRDELSKTWGGKNRRRAETQDRVMSFRGDTFSDPSLPFAPADESGMGTAFP